MTSIRMPGVIAITWSERSMRTCRTIASSPSRLRGICWRRKAGERTARHRRHGLLALGPRPLVQQDRIRMIYDVVDEQIDTTSKAFLGLTVACARCHDHKFDPS